MYKLDILKNFGLLILLWNCRSLTANLIEFNNYLNKVKPNIICLTETWLKGTININISGYNLYRNDRFGSKGGGVAILVRQDITVVPNNFNYFTDGFLESLVITVQLNQHKCNICVIYNPNKKITESEFAHYFSNLDPNTIICGDFNAHDSLWSNHERIPPNYSGKMLRSAYDSNLSYNLLTPKALETHLNLTTGLYSTIDLMFGSGIFTSVDEVVVQNPLGTDHNPVMYCFNCNNDVTFNNAPSSWNLNKINWKNWKDDIKTTLIPDKLYSYEELTNVIKNVTENHSTLSSKKIKTKYRKNFWDAECSKMVALRRRARKCFQKSPSPETRSAYNKQAALTKRLLKKKKKESWLNFCSNIDEKTPDKAVWNMFRRLEGKPSFDFQYPITDISGDLIQEPKLIAENFAKYYSLTFGNSTPVVNQQIKDTTITTFINFNSNANYNTDFNLNELENAILSLNPKSSMGPDHIHNKFFINFPKETLHKLLETINHHWNSGIVPDFHKVATLIPILKPGKDKHCPSSYRPIALISCFSKLIEKLVFNRLYAHLENNNLINTNQCGFRKQHSCLDILTYLEHHIQIALRQQKVLLIVFCDIEKAFDSASHTAILYTLYNKGIRGRLLRWISDFFSNRYFNVRINNNHSNNYSSKQGVPQGAILSPLLFTLLLSEMPEFRDTHTLMYADDLSLFVLGDSLEEAINKLQNSLNSCSKWLKNQALVLNPSKTQLMMFTRKRISVPPNVFLNNQKINYVTKHKFLGLILDGPHLSWSHHIAYLKVICSKKINIMRALTSSSWGANRHLLTTFYNSFIKSKISYGLEVYSSASNTELKSLEVIQNSAIRIITGLPRPTPVIGLHIESNFLSIFATIHFVILKFFFRIQLYPNNHILNKLYHDHWDYLSTINWTTYPHKRPLLLRASDLCQKYDLTTKVLLDNAPYYPPPWINFQNFISTDFGITKKNDVGSSQIKCIFQNMLYVTYKDFTKCYTDGSKMRNAVGSAVFVEEDNLVLSWRIDSNHSVLVAELFAIFNCLTWLLQGGTNKSIVIFSDSLTALNMIGCAVIKTHWYIISKIKKLLLQFNQLGNVIVLQWIPSHSGLAGNDFADQMAKNACEYEVITNLPLEYEELLNLSRTVVYNSNKMQLNSIRNQTYFGKMIESVNDWTWISSGNRHCDVILAKLRYGVAGLNLFLNRINLSNSPNCYFCQNTIETPHHYILVCPRYILHRNKLFSRLNELGLNQHSTTLSILLSGSDFSPNKRRRIMSALYTYFIDTGRINQL